MCVTRADYNEFKVHNFLCGSSKLNHLSRPDKFLRLQKLTTAVKLIEATSKSFRLQPDSIHDGSINYQINVFLQVTEIYLQIPSKVFERTSNQLDLRFIPDSVEFKHQPRHVAAEDHRTFGQRYYEFLDYFRILGPIFLKICGESALNGIPNDYLSIRMCTTQQKPISSNTCRKMKKTKVVQ
uniref:Uncharacterized protein LOC104249682 n=1 Tax=Nicotiana sylvestris TaxID=4096 RepID=A0A1U7Z0L9_NICSY|nr:PREDICTED: uncharacterized protein LOC104249682 [Nicotiana sylvestris]